MRCERCQQELQEEEYNQYGNETLCEDCYLVAVHRVIPCDPWAAHHAQSYRECSRVEGTDGLSEVQKALYDFIRDKGRVSMDELPKTFDLLPNELQTNFAVLRHCGLVRAYKDNDTIYLTTFDQE